MGKSSPKPPDYAGAAAATTAGNQSMLNSQTAANRPDVYTPWGSQTWTQTPRTFDQAGYDEAMSKYSTAHPGDKDGSRAPIKDSFYKEGDWTSNISLSPQQQAALDAQFRIQQGRSGAAETLLDQATGAFQRPFNWNDLQERGPNFNFGDFEETQKSLNGDSGAYRQRAQDAITKLQQPDLDRRRAAEQTRLANQGITQGSEAYKADMQDVDDAESRAHLMAIGEGRNESNMAFDQDLKGAALNNTGIGADIRNWSDMGSYNSSNRNAMIAEEAQRRGMTLNELNALLTGQQVNMPNIPQAPGAGKGQGIDYTGVANNQYGAALDASNAQNAQSANTASTAAQLAGVAAYFAFSDARLKEDIREVGLLSSGVRVVHYRYRGRPRSYVGVIAQEVARVIPEAVVLHPSGYLMVDYSKVQ